MLRHRDSDTLTRRREFVSVADEIEQDAVPTILIAIHKAVTNFFSVNGERNALRLHLRLKHRFKVVENFLKVNFRRLQFHVPGFDSAHFENVIYQIKQVLARNVNLRHERFHLRKSHVVALSKRRVADNRVHWRSYVVAHVRQES